MIADNLRDLVTQLEAAGELARVSHPVSVDRAMAEIADRCMKSPGGGPALLFEQPLLQNGSTSSIPVAINLFGSMRRMSMALGVDDLDSIGARISELLKMKVPEGWREKIAMFPTIAEIAKFPPRTIGKTPACQEVVVKGSDVDLTRLPIMTCWPEDGGPYITLPQVITNDPKTGVRNVGMYRIQVLERDRLAMHWQRHKVGAAHWREMAERGDKMPVAIALGGDPASIYSASAPLPPNVDEYIFAGFLRRKPVQLAKAAMSDLLVPAEAEVFGPDDLPIEVHVELECPEPNLQRAFAATLAQHAHAADRQVQNRTQIADQILLRKPGGCSAVAEVRLALHAA